MHLQWYIVIIYNLYIVWIIIIIYLALIKIEQNVYIIFKKFNLSKSDIKNWCSHLKNKSYNAHAKLYKDQNYKNYLYNFWHYIWIDWILLKLMLMYKPNNHDVCNIMVLNPIFTELPIIPRFKNNRFLVNFELRTIIYS